MILKFQLFFILESWDLALDGPDHSLKIYKSDQQYKYLLVHQVNPLFNKDPNMLSIHIQ